MAKEKLKIALADPLVSAGITDRKAVVKHADGTSEAVSIDAEGWVQFLAEPGTSGTIEFTDTNIKGDGPTTVVPFAAAQYPPPTAPPDAPIVLGWG